MSDPFICPNCGRLKAPDAGECLMCAEIASLSRLAAARERERDEARRDADTERDNALRAVELCGKVEARVAALEGALAKAKALSDRVRRDSDSCEWLQDLNEGFRDAYRRALDGEPTDSP